MIYMDHAATTPLHPLALDAMMPYFSQSFGNASNVYGLSLAARRAMDNARETIASCLGAAAASEIVFTGGGSEADNLAVIGLAKSCRERGHHIIISRIEHPAVLQSAKALEEEGWKVTKIGTDKYGTVDIKAITEAITPETSLISVMLANNEIGTIQPISEIADIIKGRGIMLHTDAVQAAGAIPIDVQALGADALSISSHKFYGPKGTGALYLRSGLKPWPVIHGGGQEHGLRAGTENIPGIVGMAKALEIACANLETNAKNIAEKRNKLIELIKANVPDAILTGHPINRLPGNASFAFPGTEGESLVMQLDRKGICASSGSACSSSAAGISHVLEALDLPESAARGSLRLTLGRLTTDDDIEFTVQAVCAAVKKIKAACALRKDHKRASGKHGRT